MTDQNNPPAPVAGDTGADAGPMATVFPAWKSFSVEKPPEDAALDDPSCKTTRVVLVTNNLNARNRMGQMSHLWLARPIKGSDGEWCAYTDGDQKIHSLTHWFDPFGASQDDNGHCHECGKTSSDGWALYCVACMEKAGLIAAPVDAMAKDVERPSSKVCPKCGKTRLVGGTHGGQSGMPCYGLTAAMQGKEAPQ